MKSRAQWLMRHPIQAKYLLIVILAMFLPILLFGYCFYSLVFDLLAKQIVFPEAINSNLVPVIDRINGILIVTLPVVILAILFFALVISHRFGGPIERLESDLDRVLQGDVTHPIRVRKSDDLGGVVKRVNVLIERLRSKG